MPIVTKPQEKKREAGPWVWALLLVPLVLGVERGLWLCGERWLIPVVAGTIG
jgi:hypothetical protein